MPRALLSVSDKTGLIPLARALSGLRVRTGVHWRNRTHARASRCARHQYFGCDRLSRDHGRQGQDAAPIGPWRHPGPPQPPRRHGDARHASHHPHRPGRRQPVSVRQGGRKPRHPLQRAPRGDRHRRAEHGALGREELSGGARCRRSGGLRPGDVRACSGPAGRRWNFASIWRARHLRTPRRTTRRSQPRSRSSAQCPTEARIYAIE